MYLDDNVLVADECRVTPLHLACKVDDVRCLKLLLLRLADADLAHLCTSFALALLDLDNRSPLHYVCAACRPDHLRVLLDDVRLPLNVNERDCLGRTPLMWAAVAPFDRGLVLFVDC